ncbi:hypothetical protein Lalb_Chr03g0034621 [Lupinus albus]|uniref:Uncharacterized protein n=1 Tax=Lupinus albus TaxID=3870 RepID=A0A6A4QSN6_LUPAL|nr:hypothetical protein Lalb_Chr03g0034621 [Lupinus albus]
MYSVKHVISQLSGVEKNHILLSYNLIFLFFVQICFDSYINGMPLVNSFILFLIFSPSILNR